MVCSNISWGGGRQGSRGSADCRMAGESRPGHSSSRGFECFHLGPEAPALIQHLGFVWSAGRRRISSAGGKFNVGARLGKCAGLGPLLLAAARSRAAPVLACACAAVVSLPMRAPARPVVAEQRLLEVGFHSRLRPGQRCQGPRTAVLCTFWRSARQRCGNRQHAGTASVGCQLGLVHHPKSGLVNLVHRSSARVLACMPAP